MKCGGPICTMHVTQPPEPSLVLLDGLYQRWVELFQSLTTEQWRRELIHPDRGVFVLDELLPMHVWHGLHHTAHIVNLKNRMGWSSTNSV